MCGIAGIYDLRGRPVAASEVRAMNDVNQHRGPDDGGEYVEQALGLANRRLSIIDLSPAGHQPMANEDGSLVLVYNGELYNFRELAPRARGARPPIPLADRHRGRPPRLPGVGAGLPEPLQRDVRLRDLGPARRATLFLARDRFGIKPLYYAEAGGRLLFALRDEGASRAPGVSGGSRPEALVEYFTFQNLSAT